MTTFNWKYEIKKWAEKKRKVKLFQADLINLFEKAFDNTTFPEKALFGANNSALSLLTGRIFFAACTRGGVLWLLLDKQFKDIPNSDSRVVKSTKKFSKPLFWLEMKDLSNLKILIDNQEIWNSFRFATERVYNSKITSQVEHIAKKKIILADFYSSSLQILPSKTIFEIEKELEENVQQARKLSSKERQKILSKLNPKPTKAIVKQAVFNTD